MVKKISYLLLVVFISFISLTGCDSPDQDQRGCDGQDYSSDEIEFKLPPASDNGIASYQVDLLAPFSQDIIASQTGAPDETLVFELDQPRVYIRAILSALDSNGAVLGETEVGLVDVDVITGICDVTVDVSSVHEGAGTTVDVNVNCFGFDVTDVHVDTRR